MPPCWSHGTAGFHRVHRWPPDWCTLDRNGLRPSRYCITDDDLVVMASESGVLPFPENKIVRKWRLQPGKMFMIDLEQGRMVDDDDSKPAWPTQTYKQWIENCAFAQ